jgi:hypothetical protein
MGGHVEMMQLSHVILHQSFNADLSFPLRRKAITGIWRVVFAS